MMFFGPSEYVWLKTLKDLRNEFGNVVKFYSGRTAKIFLFGAEGAEKVLSSSSHIRKGYHYRFTCPWLGQSLLTSTGSRWHKHRKLLTPTFHFKILEDFLHTINDHSKTLVDGLSDTVGQTVDLYDIMRLCTLDIICETAMGVTVTSQNNKNSEYIKAIHETTVLLFQRIISPWVYNDWIYDKTAAGKKFKKNVECLKGFTKQIIQKRRGEMNEMSRIIDADDFRTKRKTSFLDLLLIQSTENGSVLTDQDIEDEVETFMFAGHDTTAANISLTLFLIALNKDVQQKCQNEQSNIFGSSNRAATSGDLASMRYLASCIKESLRLYPSVPSIGRVTGEQLEIEGHIIPPGTEITLHIMMLHRDSKYFPDPEKFDPDRFFITDDDKDRHPYAFTPFSAGLRNCIGQKFAMMEEKVVISNILRRFDMKAMIPLNDTLIAPELVLKPKKGYPVRFDWRK